MRVDCSGATAGCQMMDVTAPLIVCVSYSEQTHQFSDFKPIKQTFREPSSHKQVLTLLKITSIHHTALNNHVIRSLATIYFSKFDVGTTWLRHNQEGKVLKVVQL